MQARKLCFILLLFLFLLLCSITNSYGKSTISIGIIGPMKFSLGEEMWNGALLAADQINSKGEIRVGRDMMRVELTKIDSNEFLNVTSAANAAEILLFRNKVDFLIGGFRSEAVLAMQDVAMDHKKIFISAGAASPILTQRVSQNYDRYKYYFRGGTLNNYNLGKACFLQLDSVANILRKELGLKTIKVAIAAEKTSWVDELITAAEKNFPLMGLELVGIFRPSSVATDLSPEIKAIAATDATIVMTWFSTNVGATFAAQASELKLPAVMLGINGDALKSDFWEATEGKADYVMTLSSFASGLEISSKTKPFMDAYFERFGGVPGFTAGGTYTAIACTLIPAIEKVGTLDSDALVDFIENNTYETPHGIHSYALDDLGRPTHETKFGADFILAIGIQWQNGEMKAVWPNNYKETPDAKPLTYKGVVDFKIPPWVREKHKHP